MPAILLGLGRSDLAITLNNFFPIATGSNVGSGPFSVESGRAARTCRASGTFFNASANVNNVGTARAITVRKNLADSIIVINPTDSTAGIFSDSDTVHVVAGTDTFNGRTTGSGTAFTINWFRINFKADSGHASHHYSGSVTLSSTAAAFWTLCGGWMFGTENLTKQRMRCGGTVSFIGFTCTTADGTTRTGVFRKNNVSGAGTFSVTASTTGIFEDTTHSDTFVAGDDICLQFATQSTGTAGNSMCLITWAANINEISCSANGGGNWNSSTTVNYYTNCSTTGFQTTESLMQVPHGFDGSCKNMRAMINLSGLSSSATQTVRFRKNGANGNQVLTILGNATTGLFEDTTNSDSFLAADLCNYSILGAATGGGINFTYQMMTETPKQLILQPNLDGIGSRFFSDPLASGP